MICDRKDCKQNTYVLYITSDHSKICPECYDKEYGTPKERYEKGFIQMKTKDTTVNIPNKK